MASGAFSRSLAAFLNQVAQGHAFGKARAGKTHERGDYLLRALTGGPVDKEMISLFALGSMDVNRIGKWVLDLNTLQIDHSGSKQYHATGNTDQPDIGPNTWTLGLYTFRDMISPTKTVAQIKCLWYITRKITSMNG